MGTDRKNVIFALKKAHIPVINERSDVIYAEDWGWVAMFTPNAPRIMMEFYFGEDYKILKIQAVYTESR